MTEKKRDYEDRFSIHPGDIMPIGKPKRVVDLTSEEDKKILAEIQKIRQENIPNGEELDWS
jgi:hypothetical protein